MKSAGKARNNGLYRHIRTSKEIIRNLLNDSINNNIFSTSYDILFSYLGNGAECDRPLSNQNMGSELLGVRRSVIKVADSP